MRKPHKLFRIIIPFLFIIECTPIINLVSTPSNISWQQSIAVTIKKVPIKKKIKKTSVPKKKSVKKKPIKKKVNKKNVVKKPVKKQQKKKNIKKTWKKKKWEKSQWWKKKNQKSTYVPPAPKKKKFSFNSVVSGIKNIPKNIKRFSINTWYNVKKGFFSFKRKYLTKRYFNYLWYGLKNNGKKFGIGTKNVSIIVFNKTKSFFIEASRQTGRFFSKTSRNIKNFSIKMKVQSRQKKLIRQKEAARKKAMQVRVGYDKEYLKTFDGKLTKKIIEKFLKQKNDYTVKYISLTKDEIITQIKIGKIDIGISDFSKKSDKYKIDSVYKSPYLFSDAVYFFTHNEDATNFNYPQSIYSMPLGMEHNSNVSEYMRNNFSISKNFHFYGDKYNLIDDFKNKKLKLLLMDRKTFYENVISLPGVPLFFFDFGQSYGQIIFSNQAISSRFYYFYNNKKYKNSYEWVDYFYKKPERFTYFDRFFRKFFNAR